VWSGGPNSGDGLNYFGLAAMTQLTAGSIPLANTALTVRQAYDMDNKVDDGLPQSGKVMALYQPGGWAGNNPGVATGGYSGSCYDNGNNASATMVYSLEINSGAFANCYLSFRFQ
jgi:hypothetical protein